jgi:hypothetical protein
VAHIIAEVPVLEAAADLGPVPLVVGHATLENAAVVTEAVLVGRRLWLVVCWCGPDKLSG